ncbi:MAG: MBL fold metallo-hydrolase [Methyloligellaceae bacterium]
MPAYICMACGTEYPEADAPPDACRICEEERQYVPVTGQKWTTLNALSVTHRNSFHQYEPGLTGIGTEPKFGIGQRALLIQTEHGNILWDCVAFIDDATVNLINGLGGLSAIAISHPHFYTTMGHWSQRFGDIPIYLHGDDRDWIIQPNDNIEFWHNETHQILPGATLIRCGGHFTGATVLHWSEGAQGAGVICSGDTLTVNMDHQSLSFMRSYPNFIPLNIQQIRFMESALQDFEFERIYGHYFDRVIGSDAKTVLNKSFERYISAIANT